MELKDIRSCIDAIDDQLVKLFARRMDCSRQVAEAKRQTGKDIRDSAREREIVNRLTKAAGEEYAPYVSALYDRIFDLSRSFQSSVQQRPGPLTCQQRACGKLFKSPDAIMQYGLIGARLGHSYSPEIHARLGDYDYQLCECTERTFIDLMASRDFRGLNVTIPYKVVAYAHCDALSDTAKEVGCVNTLIVRPDGTLYGHNTDIGGFMAMAKRAGVAIAGKKCAILGSGGASMTARAACRRFGAREIIVVSRRGPTDYEALYRDHADAQVLINTTPVGMYPDNGQSPADIARLPHLTGVLDVIYNPDKTALILDAEARGIPCAGGLYMLVAQAREAAELFTGHAIPDSRTDEIYGMLRERALNLILIGMPGSGKTSIGRALAERMGREFVDCDAGIIKRAGMTIPDIFASRGEQGFRDLEARVVSEACREKGRVIATGGGAILRDQNVRAMRQNGVVVMLERSLDDLPMDGRPLSSGKQALHDMWKAREPKYRAAADACVDNNRELESAVSAVKEAFYEAAHH